MKTNAIIPSPKKAGIASLILLFTTLTCFGQSNLVTNGDFETGNMTGWSGTPASAVSGLVAGSTYAADLVGTMYQDFYPDPDGLNNGFVFDMVFKLDNTSGGQRIRLRGGPDNVANDIITMKWGSAGLYEYSGGWGLAVAQTITAGTVYHVRVTVNEANTQIVYGLSTDGTNYTSSSVYTSAHGSLGLGFETVTLEGAMVADEVSVVRTGPPPPPPEPGKIVNIVG